MAQQEGILLQLLAQSPPGEFPCLVSSLKLLTGNAELVDGVAAAAAREVGHDHMVALDLPGGDGKVLATPDAAHAGGWYLEPRSGTAVCVDHVAGVVTSSRQATPAELAPPDVEPFRVAVQDALAGYISEVYSPHGVCAVYGSGGAGAGAHVEVTVCTSSAKANLRNFWSGRLGSRWRAVYDQSTGTAALSGQLEVAVHYCEEGNVQLKAAHSASTSCQAQDAASFGSAVAEAIRRVEGQYFSGLEASFDTMAQSTFKRHLRRSLPVTRSKFPWEQAQHKLAGELASKEKAAAAAAAGRG